MSAQITRLAKKRGRLPALVTALALGGLLALQQFLGGLVAFLAGQGYASILPPVPEQSGLYDITVYQFQPTLDQLLFLILPFTIGVFVSLWLIAPISDELTQRFVLTRAGLAAVAAALVVTIFTTVKGLVDSIGAASPSFGGVVDPAEPAVEGVNFAALGFNTVNAISGGVSLFVYYLPVVMLAGVLLWLWLREHPRDYAVTGLVDEL